MAALLDSKQVWLLQVMFCEGGAWSQKNLHWRVFFSPVLLLIPTTVYTGQNSDGLIWAKVQKHTSATCWPVNLRKPKSLYPICFIFLRCTVVLPEFGWLAWDLGPSRPQEAWQEEWGPQDTKVMGEGRGSNINQKDRVTDKWTLLPRKLPRASLGIIGGCGGQTIYIPIQGHGISWLKRNRNLYCSGWHIRIFREEAGHDGLCL